MIKIKINEQISTCAKGTQLLDLIQEDNKNFCVALVNGRLHELSFKLDSDCELDFLDVTHPEACKAYEATMRYVIAMAMFQLYPDVSIRFSFNVSRSVFCQVLDDSFMITATVFSKIKKQVQQIIDQNIPIKRVTVSHEEARNIYKQYNLKDKLDILAYRPDKDVHLYQCGDYYNYLHNYMLPSTGYLVKYILRPYAPGFIFQYPRAEIGGIIPKFEETPCYGRTLKRSYEWAKLIDCQTIARINGKISSESITDFIQTCETKHNNMIAELGNTIAGAINDIRLIAIAGPSSSGKTTFSNRLRIELMSHGIKPVMISMDDYYLERSQLVPDENGELDLENINCLDIELFNQHMYSLINGESVQLPRFDFTIGKRVPGKLLKLDVSSPVIVEGIHALNEEMTTLVPKHQKFKIFISPQIQINIDNHSPMSTTDLRLIRRTVRDHQFRNAPAEKTLSMWSSVRRGEFRWIYPHQEQADYVFNSALTYELCILRKYALPLYESIGPSSPYFIVANRLIKYLKYFIDAPTDAIPCNSLIREFIGGSCFKI